MTDPTTMLIEIRAEVRSINEKMDEHAEKLEKVDYTLNGNGVPGMKTRVDRLEQSEVRRGAWTKAAVGASVGALVTALWTSLTRGHG